MEKFEDMKDSNSNRFIPIEEREDTGVLTKEIMSSIWPGNRDFTQPRRQRQSKRHLKI